LEFCLTRFAKTGECRWRSWTELRRFRPTDQPIDLSFLTPDPWFLIFDP